MFVPFVEEEEEPNPEVVRALARTERRTKKDRDTEGRCPVQIRLEFLYKWDQSYAPDSNSNNSAPGTSTS